jgi:hypothetical protein
VETKPLTHTDLTARAFASLSHFLTNKAKSNPTEAQLKVLYALMDNLSRLAFKETTGRFAWALPVGCGKTQSTMHWCAKMLEAKLDFGVAIACGQISALNDINDFLVHQLHVPQDLVGTLVSKDVADDLSGRLTFDGNDFPILLVTHARIHMGSDELSRYWQYQRLSRDLLIFDESLISSKSVMVVATEVENSFDILTGRLSRHQLDGISQEFYRTVQYLISSFQIEFNAVQHGIKEFAVNHDEGAPVPSELRYANVKLNPVNIDKFAGELEVLNAQDWSKPLLAFLDLCGATMRLVCPAGQKDSVLSYTVTVPEDISNIVILDASSPIRLLVSMDKHTITLAEELPLIKQAGVTSLAELFDYSNVSLYAYKAGGGYDSFQQDKKNYRIKDAIGLLKTIPKDEAVLFYVFKRRRVQDKKDFLAILRRELMRQGYGLNSTHICIETFGRETSLNNYAHCQHVIFVGTPWQNLNDLIARALGQMRDIYRHIQDETVTELNLSEAAYRFHQGMGRGSMRKNGPDGRPQKMSAYCFLTDQQREALVPMIKQVLPGLNTPEKRLQKRHQTTSKDDSLREALLQWFKGKEGASLTYMVGNAPCFSIQGLKVELRLTESDGVQKHTFARALNRILASRSSWTRQGRSLVFNPSRKPVAA